MSLTLYAHPFSSYSQKVLIALWENDIPFTYRHLEHEGANDACKALWPFGQFPVLLDGENTVAESSIIIEHLQHKYSGSVQLIPSEPIAALEVRFMDRFFDNLVTTETLRPLFEKGRTDGARLEAVLANAHQVLEIAYTWLENRLQGKTWATGDTFSMADCAAAPSLFYADWVHQIGPHFPILRAYRSRLLARPSFARAVEEGRQYRHYYPLGAPARD